jgi:ribosomal protein S18 acetylase RimI-like enzyme
MNTEFRRAVIPREIRSLMAFDRKVFPRSDLFDAAYWRTCVSYWMLVDGIKAGCCAFEEHADFRDDLDPEAANPPRKGSLYICSTGLLPKFQGKGLGTLLKSWELAYARYHGFTRVVTNMRSRNTAIIRLNRQFGFRVVRTSPGYYSSPADSTVVMELKL